MVLMRLVGSRGDLTRSYHFMAASAPDGAPELVAPVRGRRAEDHPDEVVEAGLKLLHAEAVGLVGRVEERVRLPAAPTEEPALAGEAPVERRPREGRLERELHIGERRFEDELGERLHRLVVLSIAADDEAA